jgi:hypothetical protein
MGFCMGGLKVSVWCSVHAQGLLDAYWAGIPLLGSPGIPLRSPSPCQQPHIPFEQGGGGLGGCAHQMTIASFRPMLHLRGFVGCH